MHLPRLRLATILLVTLLASTFALAQQTPKPHPCDETAKRLDRELSALSKRLAVGQTAQVTSEPVPPSTQVLAALLETAALREHLRCLGLNPQGER